MVITTILCKLDRFIDVWVMIIGSAISEVRIKFLVFFILKRFILKQTQSKMMKYTTAQCVNLSRKQWSFLLAGIDDLHSLLTMGVHMLTRVSFIYLCKHKSIICLHVWVKLTFKQDLIVFYLSIFKSNYSISKQIGER